MDFKRTKIVATIGPASSTKVILKEMIREGVNVVRLNFSHGTYEDHQKVIDIVRDLNDGNDENTAILADLQGPKLRIGEVENGAIKLKSDSTITISTSEGIGTDSVLYTNYDNFARDVNPGELVLLDDGKIELEVLETNNADQVKLEVRYGGKLTSNKGINLPNTVLSLPCLTKKDLQDLDWALENEVDWIGLSFVRSSNDIVELKSIIEERKKHTRVIAKIEKPEAIEDIDQIIEKTDAIMVARGDLGVEVPMQTVPLIQKMLIQKCIENSKPVIVATQMMESMIENVSPTRAEVNDVANAVLDGTDAVMLSGETSIGKYPVNVIVAMRRIIEEVESFGDVYHHEEAPVESAEDRYISDSICFNACRLANRVNASVIATMTFSGYTGFKISSQRPKALTVVFTGNKKILSMMNLVWGVKAFFYDGRVSTDDTISDILRILKEKDIVKSGDLVINIASMPIEEMGMSNMLKLSKV
jgi:pyruvate kinase